MIIAGHVFLSLQQLIDREREQDRGLLSAPAPFKLYRRHRHAAPDQYDFGNSL